VVRHPPKMLSPTKMRFGDINHELFFGRPVKALSIRPLRLPYDFIRYHLWTCFLFVVDDIKTIIIPCTVFSLVTSPIPCTPQRMALVLGWIFLHLLLCDVSNQSTSSLEDEANKPYRPIPSGRLSDETAKRLLVVLYGVCLLVSYYLDLLQCSFILGLLAFGYNTLDMSRHWLAKSLFNAAAYVCFEYGGTFLAADGRVDDIARTALWITFSVIAFTIHSQDLKDIEGDRLSNRLTLPIRFGEEVSRVAFLLGLLGCSVAVPHVWQLCVALRLFFVAFGAYIGVRTYRERTVAQDKRNFKTYNVWLVAIRLTVLAAR